MMKLGSQIKQILSTDEDNFYISLLYTDGFKGTIRLGFIFDSPKKSTLPLEIKRGNLFSKCFVESGALAWPNGFELCPDAIRIWISEQKKIAA
ncbi:hypothetical protein EBR03_08495 [bacterium]|nr:hypothetical protein [bacterium]